MKTEEKLQIMRNLYTGLQAETILMYEKAGVLESIEKEKRELNLKNGKGNCVFLGIENIKDTFLKPSEIVKCAQWELDEGQNKLTAVCRGCKLALMCKNMNLKSPCRLYCLNPIEGMIKSIKPDALFSVESTLIGADKCKIEVTW